MFCCKLCHGFFPTRVALKRHLSRVVHVSVPVTVVLKEEDQLDKDPAILRLICDPCQLSFEDREALDRHLKSSSAHSQENLSAHRCRDCDYNTVFAHKLKQHRRKCHLKDLSCSLCDWKCRYKSKLDRHYTKKHESETLFLCPRCEFRARTEWDLEKHVKTKHMPEAGSLPEGEDEFRCYFPECRKIFGKKQEFNDHLRLSHTNITEEGGEFVCRECGNITDSKSKALEHFKSMHWPKGLVPNRHRCVFAGCDYSNNKIGHVQRHVNKVHLEMSPHLCPSCGATYASKTALKDHQDRVHPTSDRYKCGECDYSTNVTSDFKRHVYVRHNPDYLEKQRQKRGDRKVNRATLCNNCGNDFSNYSNLENHLKRKICLNPNPKNYQSKQRATRKDVRRRKGQLPQPEQQKAIRRQQHRQQLSAEGEQQQQPKQQQLFRGLEDKEGDTGVRAAVGEGLLDPPTMDPEMTDYLSFYHKFA